jgi:hypothetical protein
MASPDASRGDENEIASAIARRRRVLTCLRAPRASRIKLINAVY